jgi:cellobiose phosphorylase
MDMARNRGESVAFTALYAANLADLAALTLALGRLGVQDVELAAELPWLLDTLRDPVDYEDVAAKQGRLAAYNALCGHTVSGSRVRVSLVDLSADLRAKADWLAAHIAAREWVTGDEGHGWFNGYYDDDGNQVEGLRGGRSRMTLTGQVFTLLAGIATPEQAASIVRAADQYLYDPAVGGYRLNTDFGEVLLNLGRCFGFAYGHKENGAMFSHMAVMYAYALYARGLPAEGWKVLSGIYRHCQDFPHAGMYPGLPEYVNARGRGVYGWLTGSASWYILTLLTQVFGVRGDLGDLVLAPQLAPDQFDEAGQAAARALFAGRQLEIVYVNPTRLPPGACRIDAVALDGAACPFERDGSTVRIARSVILALAEGSVHRLRVSLAR